MGSNKGYANEALIAEALNGKKYSEINHNLQSLIRDLFGFQDDNEIIESAQVEGLSKPDIYIRYKGQTKYISVKVGRASQLHYENIKEFVLFLRSLGVSKQTQKTLLLYQYGDGTMTGTGKKRLDNMEVRAWLKKELNNASYELNNDHDLICKVVERVIFQGINDTSQAAEYIYFGSPEYGQIVSKKQILSYINNRGWHFFECLHIGPIFFRPHARYARRKVISEKRRAEIVCYWPNFADELDRIGKRFTF